MKKRHPFQDTPQWKQQYESGLGYYGNGLGAISGADPLLDEAGVRVRRYRPTRRLRSALITMFEEDAPTVTEILDRAGLTAKQRLVIEWRHGIRGGAPLTQREIAALMGITQSAVHYFEKAAKKKLIKVLITDTH